MSGMKRARLSAVALGVALGFMCGAWMLIVSFLAWKGQSSYAVDALTRWSAIFPGVESSMVGSFVAGAWGFLKGFFMALVFGWLYNLCLCCCPSCSGCVNCNCSKGECKTTSSD